MKLKCATYDDHEPTDLQQEKQTLLRLLTEMKTFSESETAARGEENGGIRRTRSRLLFIFQEV